MADLPAPVLTVWTLPPVWGTPSASPFAVKLLTWLRMAGLPHQVRALPGPPRSPTGKIPYVILPDGTLLYDTGLIVEALGARFGVDLDAGLDPVSRARGHALRRLVEEHLYWAAAWERWAPAAARAVTVRDYFAHLPAPARPLVGWMAWRGMRANLHGHGLGRHRPEDVTRAGESDIAALAALIGEGPYALGPLATVDASVFAVLWCALAHPIESPLARAIRAQPALVAYLDRMRLRFWAE